MGVCPPLNPALKQSVYIVSCVAYVACVSDVLDENQA